MLHILLTIIKILFILLAVILLLVLSVLAAISFVPVRYGLTVQKQEDLYAKGKVTWLFRLVVILFDYSEKSGHFCVRLAGRTIVGGEPKGSRKKQRKKKKPIEKVSEQFDPEEEDSEEFDFELPEAEADVPNADDSTEVSDVVCQNERKEEYTAEEEKSEGKESHDSQAPKRSHLFEKLGRIREKFILFLKRLSDRLKNFNKAIQSFKSKLDYYKRLWYDKHTRAAIQHLKKEGGYLFCHLRPRKVNGRIRFGLDDPAATGWIAGLLCILQSFSGNNLIAEAEFDEKVFEGDFSLKGHIRICHIWKAALSLILDKHCRITYKRVLKLLQGGN